MKISHDGTIDIATGRSRKETNWKNKEWLWSDLVKKLSETHRTAETHAEYMASKKTRQDEIKDIGGFVGGYLSSGRRKAGNVLHRQLVTLDIDHGSGDVWDDFTLLFGNAACVYSTHKHKPEAPRLRLIIPLDREVGQDEYMAISRRIAGHLGIDNFDHTTFEPSRLMYWPSTPKDGVYVFDYQDGPWLSADEILGSYHDWRDSSEWPVSAHMDHLVQRAIKKQGDPLEKPGLIGAFCRVYDIHQAIETFLADVYEPCAIENRYTYTEGSTAAGLVVYDEKYAYSHHGTDPTSGKLCNAFDLVRIHKYGLKDEDVREGTPVNKMPSYVAMTEFAAKDPTVRKLVFAEKRQEAAEDFSDLPEDEEYNDDWTAELDVDKKGHAHSTINNIITIIENDPGLKGRFAFNQFEQREIALRNLPWRKVSGDTKYLTDKDDAGLRHYLEKHYGITGVQKIRDGLDLVLVKNSFHPVRDYLQALSWDGEERLDTLLVDYLGAEDSEYVRAVTRKAFVAAVARVMQPGVKFDYVLTLVGKQGIGKSSLIKRLGRHWYSDSLNTIQGKEAFEQIQGVWLVEMGELAGLKKMDLEHIKHFISKQEDRYRVAYGRRIENFPRQCIFFGTTNNRDFLRDPTGNRRFWPVETMEHQPEKNVFDHMSDKEIDRIWAEAVELYKGGESLYLDSELETQALRQQTEHTEKDDRIGVIETYLNTPVPENWEELNVWDRRSFLQGDELIGKGVVIRDKICIAEIWCELFGGTQKDLTNFNTKDLHTIMQNMPGWTRTRGNRRFGFYGQQKAYERVKIGQKSANASPKSAFAAEE